MSKYSFFSVDLSQITLCTLLWRTQYIVTVPIWSHEARWTWESDSFDYFLVLATATYVRVVRSHVLKSGKYKLGSWQYKNIGYYIYLDLSSRHNIIFFFVKTFIWNFFLNYFGVRMNAKLKRMLNNYAYFFCIDNLIFSRL